MSKDNLILFPKKSTSIVSMSENEAKWMISASLLVILTLAVGINSTLFSSPAPNLAGDQKASVSRSIASVDPLFKVSWEKKAFEVLKNTEARDLASVGKGPSAFDEFAFGALEGKYSIRMIEGKIAEIKFASQENNKPKFIKNRHSFIEKNMAFFSSDAKVAQRVHHESNDEINIERFQLKNSSGQDLGVVQVLSDKNNNLISMTAQ